MNRIIITDDDHSDTLQEEKIIHGAGLDFTLFQCRTEDDLIQNCKGAEVMINQYAPFTRRVIESLKPELRLIIRYGVGVDNIDMDAATDNHVAVCNVPDYGMNEVADHAAALALALLRKIPLMTGYTRDTGWDYTRSIPIHRINGCTAGIVGMGRIGRNFAKRMQAFGCRVIGFDIMAKPGSRVEDIECVSFDQLISASDLISIHCPLTDDTRDLFNAETFGKMKNTACLVNTSRGNIVNEDDLYEALKNNVISGAALDVVAKEPLDRKSPLFTLDNFLATPHMGWYSEEAALELNRKVAEEAVRFVTGKPLRYQLNSF